MKWKLRESYLDLPIRYKILLWFIPLLVATIGATGVYSYRIASAEIVGKMELTQMSTAHQVADQLNYIAQDALDITDYLFLIPDIQELLSIRGEGGTVSQAVIDSINRLMVTRSHFKFLTLYSSRFETIQFNNKGLSAAIPFEEYKALYGYDKILANKRTENWSVELPGVARAVFNGDSMNKILLTRVLKNDRDFQPEGVILLGMDELDFRRSYVQAGSTEDIAVIGPDGIVLSDSTGRYLGKPMQELPYFSNKPDHPERIGDAVDSGRWVSAQVRSPLTGWHVLVVQPRSELLQQLNYIKWLTVAIAFVTLLLSFIVSWAVSGVIASRVRRILSSMKKFQKGDFTQQVRIAGQDEIGQLGAGYNIMVQRIRELIDDVYSFELKQKQAELKVLQSQINPHFLYNTLNTIAWTAHKNGDPATAEMIYSLSGIFKISLSEGKDIIPLQQELELVEHYLFLQKMRFPDKLSYEFEIDADAEPVLVPKLLLQPLVENAVVHGIEPLMGEAGTILVKATLSGPVVEIEVTDNGAGIPEEKLVSLLRKIQSGNAEGEGEDFALLNIVGRIRMFYGEQASFDIHSVAGSGTRILIHLPAHKR
jgi:two-component system sensor histidine kinase YesM